MRLRYASAPPRHSRRGLTQALGIMTVLPEIFCDLNAQMTVHGYLLTTGSHQDLAKLGLTAETALGMRFTFNGGDDTREGEEPVEIVFDGTIQKDQKWGYLAVSDTRGVYWRPKADA